MLYDNQQFKQVLQNMSSRLITLCPILHSYLFPLISPPLLFIFRSSILAVPFITLLAVTSQSEGGSFQMV